AAKSKNKSETIPNGNLRAETIVNRLKMCCRSGMSQYEEGTMISFNSTAKPKHLIRHKVQG
ncbi:hypothetical protein, partial [Streptococcus anginosus]|uniref:hypothetical protein n=1 Tax=Streptococcus anginosus TaxID=1328 RepID=UPI002ED8E295